MKVYFGWQDLWEVVDQGYSEPTEEEEIAAMTAQQRAALKEVKRKDSKALFQIYQSVDESHFEKISAATTSQEAWEILRVAHRGVERTIKVRPQVLRGEFENLEMESNESIFMYFTRALIVVNQLRRYGEKMEDVRVLEKILRSSDPKLDNIAGIVEEAKDLNTI